MIQENSVYVVPVAPPRHTMLLAIIAMACLGSLAAWYIMATRGLASPALQWLQGVTVGVTVMLFVAAWWRLMPHRVVAVCALLYTVAACMACMVLHMYWPRYGASLDLEPLYLWFPVLYVFAFMLTGHRVGLLISLSILALFVAVSLPWLLHNIGGPDGNITVQIHIVSAVLIVALYFYSGYRDRLQRAQEKVHELAGLSQTDELTGLANRRAMAAVVDAELARQASGGGSFALLLFDIDRFKEVNDGFGHGEGDKTLIALSARARHVLRGSAVLGRWGGDEFVALVRTVDARSATRLARELCAAVAATPLPSGRSVTISCGVTVARSGDRIDGLLQRADAALYVAKRAGRNRTHAVLEQR